MNTVELVRSLVDARLKLIECMTPANPIASLYCYRPLLNVAELQAWMRQHSFPVPAPDMHVTITYSKAPISWEAIPPCPCSMHVTGGDRAIEQFGEGATVLTFTSNKLQERWQEFMDAGASFDHDSYRPHVTLTYEDASSVLHKEPFRGNLFFGPEVYKRIELDG